MLNSNTEVNSIYAYSVAIKSGIGGRFMRTTLCVWPCKQRNEQELKNVSWRHRKKPFHFSVILVLKVMLHFSFLFFFFKSSLLFNFSKTMMTSVAVCRKAVCCQIDISIIKNRQTENPELVTWNAWFFRDSEYITHSQLNYIKTRNTFYCFNRVYQYFLRY